MVAEACAPVSVPPTFMFFSTEAHCVLIFSLALPGCSSHRLQEFVLKPIEVIERLLHFGLLKVLAGQPKLLQSDRARLDRLEQRFVHSGQRASNSLVNVYVGANQADIHASGNTSQNVLDLGKRKFAGLESHQA